MALGAALGVGLLACAEDPAPPPEPCGTDDAPACTVASAPCSAAGTRDRNPADRAVAPTDELQVRESPGAPLPFGFNDPAVANGQLSAEQDAELHTEVGSTITRVVLDWGAVEAAPNEFDFSASDDIYCSALAAGVRPLFTVTGVPPWALDDPGSCEAAPCVQPPAEEHLPAWRRFNELAAIRYPQAAAFEAWNEPNFTTFWPSPDPARYARLLRELYLGVKEGSPSTPVLGGSVTNNPTDDPSSGTLSLATFLTEMFAAGAADYMDGLSIHGYPIGPLGSDQDLFTPQLAEAKRIAAAAAPDRTMPLWVTETGATTQDGGFAPAVSPEEQAQEMVAIYEQLRDDPAVDAVLFHSLVDPTTSSPGGGGFGWFADAGEARLVAKPVVCAFRDIAGLEGCPPALDLG